MLSCRAGNRGTHETHLPAPQCPPRPNARLSSSHVHPGWSQSAHEPPSQGPQEARSDPLQEVGGLLRAAAKGATRGMPFGADRRLRKHAEFVRAQGDRGTCRVGTTHFTLLLAAQRVPGPSRLGLVVGRRIGGAVQRNRVKRLCRECFRTHPDLLPEGIDLIVIARAGTPELDLEGVRSEWLGVERLLRKRAAEALARASHPHHPGSAPRRT